MTRFKDYSQDDHVRVGYSHEELQNLLSQNQLETIILSPTCGYFGSLAWELDKLVEHWPFLFKAIAKLTYSQILKILVHLDSFFDYSDGNGVMILAKKIDP